MRAEDDRMDADNASTCPHCGACCGGWIALIAGLVLLRWIRDRRCPQGGAA